MTEAQRPPSENANGATALKVLALPIRVVLALFLFALGLSLLFHFTIPDDVLLRHPAAIVVYLFKQHDIYWIAPALILLAAWRFRLGAPAPGQVSQLAVAVEVLARHRAWPWLFAALTLALAGLGRELVFHRYALSPDEFFVEFAAASFLQGHLLSPIAEAWRDYALALQPRFVQFSADFLYWSPLWRPGNALLVALFALLKLEPWTHAVLAAGSIPLIAGLARRLWPATASAPVIAAGLLALSPQFAITAMTQYAMTAHLFFGLLWLTFYLRDTAGGHAAAAIVGFFAVGLHHFHIHPLFVLPFMVTLLWHRRWPLALFYALWYALAIGFWFFWRDLAEAWLRGDASAIGGIGDLAFLSDVSWHYLTSHGPIDLLYWAVNLSRFISWQNLTMVLLAYAGLRSLRGAPLVLRQLAWAIGLSLLPYILLMPSQGHGWGYRFMHPLLGNFVLLAVHGWITVRQRLAVQERQRAAAVLIALALIAGGIGIPLRMWQAEAMTRPFALASRAIAGLDADVVLLDIRDSWFASAMVRNDPLLRNRPKVMSAQHLSAGKIKALCRGRRVLLLQHAALAQFGILAIPDDPAAAPVRRRALRQIFADAGCAPLDLK